MTIDIKTSTRATQVFAVGVLALSLAACDSKPIEQTSRDADQIVNRSPSPAAGKESAVEIPEGQNQSSEMNGADKSQTAQIPDDATLNMKVQDAINANFTLKSLPIRVQTSDGVVTLTGSAQSVFNRERAALVAMNVAGVKAVESKLSVSGT
jgi:hyperosmotically inducible periplasmic protein